VVGEGGWEAEVSVKIRAMSAACCVSTLGFLVMLARPITFGDQDLVLKTEHFDRDPGWEGFNNRITPNRFPTVKQEFGYSKTTHATKDPGEIGGQVWRSTTPAYYAKQVSRLTLQDKLEASGTFALTASSGGCGLFFGWFNANQPGGGRPINSLGWFLDGEKAGARLYVCVVTATNRAHGAFVTPFQRGKKVLPIKPDGTRHKWSMSYDPADNGTIRFILDNDEPVVTTLPVGFKQEGAVFDRFGLMNIHKAGHPLQVYIGDLTYGGKAVDLSHDPEWRGRGNRITYQDRELTGAQGFGFSDTDYAGGAAGELGGIFWRAKKPFAYYADKVGSLSLDDPLSASGRIAFRVGAPDSAMCIGWFNSSSKESEPSDFRNVVGICLEGPSRIGHYFRPIYATGKGSKGDLRKGPVLIPDGKPHSWGLKYDPKAHGGDGALRLTLDKETITLDLQPGHKADGAQLDRFGVFTVRAGGSHVKVYFDDLEYTVGRKKRSGQ
jgi:hypothetical protein